MGAIVMKDGRSVEFGEKAKVIKNSSVQADGSVLVSFDFRNGETRTFTMAASHPLFARAAQHGLDQKLGDSFSGIDDVDDCVLAFEKVQTQLDNKDWNKGRASDGMAGTSTLAKALVKVTGKTIEEVKATLAKLEPAQKAALRKQAAVAAAIAEIEAEKAKNGKGEKVNADDVLAAFTTGNLPAATPAADATDAPKAGKKSNKDKAPA